MEILETPIAKDSLKKIAERTFGDMVKAVVDIDKELVAVDAVMHADLEALLLKNGSMQENLWGINFYPGQQGDNFLEYDSMINMRPTQGNMSRGVDDETVRMKIAAVVNKWILP